MSKPSKRIEELLQAIVNQLVEIKLHLKSIDQEGIEIYMDSKEHLSVDVRR